MLRKHIEALLLAGMLMFGAASIAETAPADGQIQAAVTKQLQKKSQFKDDRASVQDGIVTLQGTTQTLKQKLDAEKAARKQANVKAVRDLVEVAGSVPDSKLRDNLVKQLTYANYGYSHVFDAFAVGVKDGVVTLSGEAWDPFDHSTAVGIVQTTPGVKGLVDQVKIAPNSIYDNELRERLVRAIYGYSSLSQYALDPAAPIRIVVDNGHVSLYGSVDNNMDRQLAFMRASQVFGAFSVQNHLQTANTTS